MDEIRAIASAARGVPIIEDACQAIGAEYKGQRAGSLGTMGCLSFYPTKNLGGFGDGGMITTNDGDLAAKLRVLRDHGQQPRYYHHYVGLNSRLDALQAAVLGVKLPHLDEWAREREQHAARYAAEFAKRGLGRELIGPHRRQGLPARLEPIHGSRDGRPARCAPKVFGRAQIGSAIYYPVPLHLQKCFAPLGYREGSLPKTEQACREVLSLPVYPELSAAEQGAVIDAIEQFCLRSATGNPPKASGGLRTTTVTRPSAS